MEIPLRHQLAIERIEGLDDEVESAGQRFGLDLTFDTDNALPRQPAELIHSVQSPVVAAFDLQDQPGLFRYSELTTEVGRAAVDEIAHIDCFSVQV